MSRDSLYRVLVWMILSRLPSDPTPSQVRRVVDEVLEDVLRHERLVRALLLQYLTVAACGLLAEGIGRGEDLRSAEGASEARPDLTDPLSATVALEDLMAYSAYLN